MKRKVMLCGILTIATISVTSAALAKEEASYFGYVTNNWDTVYNVPHYDTNGGYMWRDGNITLTSLPYGMANEGTIYTACCYNGKIYYSTGPDGSSILEPTKIYSCDLNGTNNVLLADDAAPYNDAIIVDNVLYYTEYRSQPSGVQGYNGDITKTN